MPEVVVGNPDEDWERRRRRRDELNDNDENDDTAFNPAPPRPAGRECVSIYQELPEMVP